MGNVTAAKAVADWGGRILDYSVLARVQLSDIQTGLDGAYPFCIIPPKIMILSASCTT